MLSLPLVNENQVTHVNNRFINGSSRPISDVLEIANSLDIEGLLMAVDIEKTLSILLFVFY